MTKIASRKIAPAVHKIFSWFCLSNQEPKPEGLSGETLFSIHSHQAPANRLWRHTVRVIGRVQPQVSPLKEHQLAEPKQAEIHGKVTPHAGVTEEKK